MLVGTSPSYAVNKFWWATGLTGGGGSLDGIDGSLLVDGDMAIVGYDNSETYQFYPYRLEDYDSNPPDETTDDYITPNSNGGNKRWKLLEIHAPNYVGTPDGTTINTWTASNIFKGGLTIQQTDGTPIFVFPTTAQSVGLQLLAAAADGAGSFLSTPEGCIVGGTTGGVTGCLGGSSIWTLLQSVAAGGTTISDAQFLCGSIDGETGEWTHVSCGEPVVDHSAVSSLLCKDSDGEIEACTLVGLELSGTTTPIISVVGVVSSAADVGTTAGRIKHDSDDTAGNSGGALEWYDGAQIRTVVDTGTNYTIIAKTEFLPIRYAEDGTTAPDAAAAITGKTLIARGFAEADDVVFFWIAPNDYVGGVKYRVHYALSTDGEANDTATFSMTGCIIANSGDIACSAGTALAISDEIGTDDDQYQYMVTDYSAESNADWGVAAGGLIKLGFSYAAAGDYTHDALVVGIEIKYKAKIIGVAGY